MTIKLAAIAAMCIALAACSDQGRVVGSERRAAVITAVNPPKHFGITVRDATGHVQEISVSKHCNTWRRNARVGAKVTVYYDRISYKDGRRGLRVTKRGLRERLCGGW